MINDTELDVVEVASNPEYLITATGRVYTKDTGRLVKPSRGTSGWKVNLHSPETGLFSSYTLAKLVGDAFVRKPDLTCDTIIFLNNDRFDCNASNLGWRPYQYARSFQRQFNHEPPRVYNFYVQNTFGEMFDSPWEAALRCGYLLRDIIDSIETGEPIFGQVAFDAIPYE